MCDYNLENKFKLSSIEAKCLLKLKKANQIRSNVKTIMIVLFNIEYIYTLFYIIH